MASEDTLMFAEAAEAADVAERQARTLALILQDVGSRLRQLDPTLVITCARGSSDHAATYAKYLIETRLGVPVASHAPSISSIYGTRWQDLRRTLFLVISQSGRSPDLIASAEAARAAGALVVALVNAPDSPLEQIADVMLPMEAGPEKSVAATKSFIGSLLAIARLVANWRQDDALTSSLGGAPEMLRGAWALDWSPAVQALREASSLYVLGRGLSLAVAQEAALKLKETCALHAEAYSAAEVRHGPMAIVGRGFPVLMLAPEDAGQADFAKLAEDFVGRGALVVTAGGGSPGALSLPVLPVSDPALAPIAAILSFYRMVATLSVARGLDPDQPPHLKKVTETR